VASNPIYKDADVRLRFTLFIEHGEPDMMLPLRLVFILIARGGGCPIPVFIRFHADAQRRQPIIPLHSRLLLPRVPALSPNQSTHASAIHFPPLEFSPLPK